jgi:hypothetical protein
MRVHIYTVNLWGRSDGRCFLSLLKADGDVYIQIANKMGFKKPLTVLLLLDVFAAAVMCLPKQTKETL